MNKKRDFLAQNNPGRVNMPLKLINLLYYLYYHSRSEFSLVKVDLQHIDISEIV